jgi:hypothetical protein
MGTNNKEDAVFWDVSPCGMVHTDRRFRGAYFLHYRGGNLLFHFPYLSVLINHISYISVNFRVHETRHMELACHSSLRSELCLVRRAV